MKVPRDENAMLRAFARAGIDIKRLVVGSLRPMSSLFRGIKLGGARIILDEKGKFVAMHRDSVKTVIRFIDEEGVEHVLYEIGRIYQMLSLKYPENCKLKRQAYSLSGTREMILVDGKRESEHPFVTVRRETKEELGVDIDALGAVLTVIQPPALENAEPHGHPSSIYPGITVIENKTFVDCLLAICPPELRWPRVADDDFTFVMFEWSPPFRRKPERQPVGKFAT